MPASLTPQAFVIKWRNAELSEISAYQQHFLDLCRLIEHPFPADVDASGKSFTFQAHVDKVTGAKGFADVWKKGYFAWEYKGKHKDLDKAYQQLLQYREALQNPPLLVVSDMNRIVVHTNFTNTVKRVTEISLEEIATPEGLAKIRAIFTAPERFRGEQTTEEVTKTAAAEFARIAQMLAARGVEPHAAAHFLIRILFCLFAEDIGLLPSGLFTRFVAAARTRPENFNSQLSVLFAAMAHGGMFGAEPIRHFNGGLFNDASTIELDAEMLNILSNVGALDWSSIEPAIFGTLFERSLDPTKRSQLGAHYTSREDILLIVEPVLMAPLRRRWAEVQAEANRLKEEMDAATSKRVKDNRFAEIGRVLRAFASEIASVQVLDPACGSGNFLYVALKQLLDLEKEVMVFAGNFGIPGFTPLSSPLQLHGIEINAYAHELAQATIWIGYIQWLNENGFGIPAEPILSPLNSIVNMDAILAYDENGKPIEPEWPKADVIIGNPPFLGGKRLRTELGNEYIDNLFAVYHNRVPREADLVMYFFQRTREYIATGSLRRAGLLATNSVRGGANREVLQHIKESGDIFMAWADRPWVLNGAAVRVSMIGFDAGAEQQKELDGQPVTSINSDLTGATDLTTANRLRENAGLVYMGDTKGGAFDIPPDVAATMLEAKGNPNGRPNSDVVKPWVNGLDVTRRPRNMWIIDFGVDVSREDAAMYEAPFEYVAKHVKPFREQNNRAVYRERWWIHMEPRPALRAATQHLNQIIVTPSVAKHRLFKILPSETLPDHQLLVFARDDDYFFGILQSRLHELWSLRMCSWMGAGNDPRYTPTTTFETFPFPWLPGMEPQDDPLVMVIAEAAHELSVMRDRWLNPEDADEKELKKRTLTNLYNQRPTWLALAHEKLDHAVLDAYGWPHDISDEEILARLLALNLERTGKQQ